MVKKAFLCLICFLMIFGIAYAQKQQTPIDSNTYLQPRSFFDKISAWRKKKKQQNPKMVTTTQEWLNVAQSIPLAKRENPKIEPEVNPKLTVVLPLDSFFVKYNNPPGGAEADLSRIKKIKMLRSEGVVDENFKKMAYIKYNFYPSSNQIASELFVIPLDTSKNRVKRMQEANVLDAKKNGNLKSGKDAFRNNYFSSLTVLDWSKNADVLLIKEKIGSLNSGIFRTNLYKVAVDEDCETLYYKKIDFENEIKHYWAQKANVRLNFYRWDIKPLGFSAEDENEAIALAFAFDKNGNEIFLGSWGVDLITGNIKLISLQKTSFDISIHGITLRYEM